MLICVFGPVLDGDRGLISARCAEIHGLGGVSRRIIAHTVRAGGRCVLFWSILLQMTADDTANCHLPELDPSPSLAEEGPELEEAEDMWFEWSSREYEWAVYTYKAFLRAQEQRHADGPKEA